MRGAGVTRGALYHHFVTKADVFREVLEREEAALADRLMRSASREADPLARLRAGCHAFLDACLDPHVRQIVLLDGPAILGWEVVREITGRHTMAMLRNGLARSAAEGLLHAGDLDARSNLLLGALCHGGMWLARCPDPREALPAMRDELDHLLRGFETGR